MSLIERLIYGLFSGLTEFLPVSSQGHQAIMLRLFGVDHRDPVLDFFVHTGVLFALLIACKNVFASLRREHMLSKRNRNRNRTYERKGVYELRLFKTAIVPMILGMLVYWVTRKAEFKPLLLVLYFVINGIIIIIPEYMAHGNKDARAMTGWDGILLGFSACISAIPGISRIATMSALTTARGADRQSALNWILSLCAPALAVWLGFDIVNLIIQGFDPISFVTVLGYILSAAAAFGGAYPGIVAMRYLTVQIGYAGFAYYSWGAAMFSFVLYLIV